MSTEEESWVDERQERGSQIWSTLDGRVKEGFEREEESLLGRVKPSSEGWACRKESKNGERSGGRAGRPLSLKPPVRMRWSDQSAG